MEFILLAVIILQFSYMVYKDILFHKEREQLQLKLMSKDVNEYVRAVEEPKEETAKEENPYVNIDDVPAQQLLEAKFRA